MTTGDALERYVRYLERLDRQALDDLAAFCTSDVRFRDPFNDVAGIDAFRAVLEKMFDDIRVLRFVVRAHAVSGQTAFLDWFLDYETDRRSGTIEGTSILKFDRAGKVASHVDHWDAASQLYEGLPLIGPLLRVLRRRLATPLPR